MDLAVVHAGQIDFSAADIEHLKLMPEALNSVYKSVLQEGTDYGTIPGTPKPTLYKPGAEILSRWLSMSPDLLTVEKVEEFDAEKPFFSYTVECRLFGRNGFLGNGFGSANSREPTFAFRWLYEDKLPKGVDKATLETKVTGPKTQYRCPTPAPEIFGLANTILKRASKRAFVEAVLRVTGASRIFTQDVEDIDQPESTPASTPAKPEQTPVQVSKEELEGVLLAFGSQVSIVGTKDAFLIYPTPQMILNEEAMKEAKGVLADYHAVWVPKQDGEKAHFRIALKV